MRRTASPILVAVVLLSVWAAGSAADDSAAAPFINTWLVAGTFDNDADNAGLDRDWINEADCLPAIDADAAGRRWRYFDDRLFSRNYDDYQDLHSYFKFKRNESVAAKVAYAHVYVHSTKEQHVNLRCAADSAFKAWFNGQPVVQRATGTPTRDAVTVPLTLRAGWNRLLLKIANTCDGRLGFYCRLTGEQSQDLAGVTFSPVGGQGPLSIVTRPMADADTGVLPAAYREWPYVGARRPADEETNLPPLRKPENALQACDFQFVAGGGTPPCIWTIAEGSLPAGLDLDPRGVIRGTVDRHARPGEHAFTLRVTDSTGTVAESPMIVVVKERPNRWYEQARLTALLHCPEKMPADGYAAFARLMRRQGYGVAMMIAYNNGDHAYRWPSPFAPDAPFREFAGKYKQALEAEGVRFGMYIGNFDGPNHGGPDGTLRVMADACRRYHPAAIWFDWAGWDGTSLDALFSVIRTVSPDTVIVLNGIQTASNGDWDILALEGWGAWGPRHWELWPFSINWPKKTAIDAWRLVCDPAFEHTRGLSPDWQEYLRLQIAIICEGHVANIDHSVTIRTPVASLDDSPTIRCHQRMADWADPGGGPPLYSSYTNVDPGPLKNASWGYSTISIDRRTIYLHLIRTPHGKTGKPEAAQLTVGPLGEKVTNVTWMNGRAPVPFTQADRRLRLDLTGVAADPVDTILRITLAGPHPEIDANVPGHDDAPAGNLAHRRPARLLTADGSRLLPASAWQFAPYGVDGSEMTVAQAGNQWAWTYEVDLQETRRMGRVVIRFGAGYATEYEVLLSADGKQWTTAVHVTDGEGGRREHAFAPIPVRYLRVRSLKPDAPNQPGTQMAIAELEAYAAATQPG